MQWQSSLTAPEEASFSATLTVAVTGFPTGTGAAKSRVTERMLDPSPGSRVPIT